MERMILSLKNVYMLLMTDDFPIYSESVIGKADRKGQTLLRFWQRQIAEEFRSLPYGRMIWRDDEKRNRYTSYLCNRSAELRCYQEYAKELASQVSPASLLGQIGRFADFLSGRKYRQDILLRRAQELMRLTEAEDPRVSPEIAGQIRAAAVPALQGEGSRGELFQAGYLLTLLTLYAAAGDAMDSASMAVLRGEGYGLEELWQAYSLEQGSSLSQEFLTIHSSLLQDNPLPWERFFGREEELYDLWEAVKAGRKCILSGMGGTGKTELLRQILRRCGEEKAADQIAVVPYIGSLVESFARAFPGFHRQESEEEFHSILYRLEQSAAGGKRILLLLDNVDKSVEEDPALAQLCVLPCGILISTRQQELEGFETYPVGPPSASAGMLIFRDNYGRPLSGEDRDVLTELLADEAMCHPATLRLMARAARSRGWSVGELRKQLKTSGVSLSWQEGDRTVRMSQMYRQLYSYMQIPGEYHALAELFTLLPRDHYSADFLRETFPEVAEGIARKAFQEADGENCPEREPADRTVSSEQNGTEDSLDQGLATLAAGGWLEYDGSGYSMHPLIAQCLRRLTLTEERLEPVLETVRKRLLQVSGVEQSEPADEELCRIGHILLSVCRFLSGPVSRELMTALLKTLSILFPTRREAEEYLELVTQLMKKCPEKNDEMEVILCTVLARMTIGDTEQIVSVYRRQKEKLTVPQPLFLEFCVQAGLDFITKKEFDLAEQLLAEISDAASPIQKSEFYYLMSQLYEYQGLWEKQRELIQEGVEYVTEHPECGEQYLFQLLCVQCGVYIRYGQKEAAESTLRKARSHLHENFVALMKGTYENLAGGYELNYGSLEQALIHYSRYQEIGLQYYGKTVTYYLGLGQIAIVLQRLGRFEEAIAVYYELLDYARETGDMMRLQVSSNNLAVLYIEMGKPEDALLHLPTALEEGRKMGGIALAEALRNMARAYELLGDTEREYGYWQEAAPLLEQVYGPEHPRTVEAKARLKELEKCAKKF